MIWKVRFFQTVRGTCPVKEFIEKQDKKVDAKTIRTIELLQNYGPFLKPPYSKKIDKNLYELRIVGQEAIRIFYTNYNQQYYLLHGFKKKSRKTPTREIRTALDRAKGIS